MNTRLEQIGSAAAGIAHDLNNQLTLILNHLALSDLDGASAAARRCGELTDALLSYSRGDKLRLRPVDTAAVVADLVSELKLSKGVIVRVSVADDVVPVEADPAALRRVLQNLVANARAAVGDKGVIRIVLRPGAIEVQDTGCGIAEDKLAHVFKPFFTTKGAAGTGLGLAIVREIMRQHGGSVGVRSREGVGTSFLLKFRPAKPNVLTE